jgi:hypothetical protein
MHQRINRFKRTQQRKGASFFRPWDEWLNEFDETMISLAEEDEGASE